MLWCNGRPLPVASIEHLTSERQRRQGLIGRPAIRPDEVLLFHFPASGRLSSAIHSCRVRFPFAAWWLDDQRRVVDLRPWVRPWRLLLRPRHPARYLIEAHPDLALRVQVGDRIEWLGGRPA